MILKTMASASGVALAAIWFSPAIQAQDESEYFDRNDVAPVSDASDPRYDQKPIPFGSFELRPEAVFSGGLQSNVLATEINELDDTYVGFTPAVSLDSNWLRHALNAYVEVDHREFSDLSDESRTNSKIKLRGRLDLGEQTSLSLTFVGADQTEDRTALSNVPTSIEPNEYTSASGRIGLEHEAGRVLFSAGLGLTSYDYDDTELEDDLFQDQDFRDRDELTASARLAYAMNRSTALYVSAEHTEADYTPAGFFNAFNRDHSGTVLLAGTDFEFGDRIRGDVGLGYQYYTYDDVTFEDISDVAFAGHVDWTLSPSTTLSAEAERAVIDPGIALTNAAIETGASVRLEQGLTPKLFLSGEAGFSQYAFETIDRDDDRLDLRVGANWRINPNIWLEGGYEVIDQTSDVQSFTDNRMMVKMRIFP